MEKNKLTRNDLTLYLHAAAAFQTLHAGVELEIFDLLHAKPLLSLPQIAESTDLSIEPARCLLFGLSVLGLVNKINDKFENDQSIEKLYEFDEWDLFRKMVKIQAHIMYVGQVDYVESLKQNTNVGIGRFPGNGKTIYEKLEYNPDLQRVFFDYMEAYTDYAITHLVKAVDFSDTISVLDVGCGSGYGSIKIAEQYNHLYFTLFDLPFLKETSDQNIKKSGLSDRIKFVEGDMFKDNFPKQQDCILFIHQFVIWGANDNKLLLQKAYDSLNDTGKVIIFNSISEDTEDGPLMAGLDTVYFRSVAAGNGMIYPWKDYESMLKDIGFVKIEKIKCNTWTPHGIVIGYK